MFKILKLGVAKILSKARHEINTFNFHILVTLFSRLTEATFEHKKYRDKFMNILKYMCHPTMMKLLFNYKS